MNRFAFTSFWRSLARHKLYALLNIGGLALGIAVFLVLALYVRFETSFERWLPRHDGIYMVETDWRGDISVMTGVYPSTMGALLDEMKGDFPDLVGTRINGGEGSISVLRDGLATIEDGARVDADFFKVFDLPMVAGDKATALRDPTAIVISRSAARKYFGDADPIGRTLTIAFDKPQSYHVTGVFEDLPRNSDLKFSILSRQAPEKTAWWDHWGSSELMTFVRFETPAAVRAFEAKMPAFITRHGSRDMGPDVAKKIGIVLTPFTDIHLKPEGRASAAKKLTIVTLGIVGVLTLLIAVVNYINLATARAGLRAREVAMRKVLGADRTTLVRHFLGEAMLTVAIAAAIGLALTELGLPLVNVAGGTTLTLPYAVTLPALLVLILVVGLAAGFYPALLLSRWPASQVLASARAPGGGRSGTRLREGLVVFQFALAIAFIVGTLVLAAQTRHVRATDLGFKREGLLVVSGLGDDTLSTEQRRSVLSALARIPGVERVTTANTAVGNTGNNNFNNVDVPGRPKPGPSVRDIEVSRDFFTTYGARLIAGRLFDDAHPGDGGANRPVGAPRSLVINRLAVARLGYASPQAAVGKTVWHGGPATIIGVIDQLHFFSPRLPDDPTAYIYRGDIVEYPIVTLRFNGDPRAIGKAAETVWRRLIPTVPFVSETGVQKLAKFYEDDDHAASLFAIGAALAVLIGCVGLWGLASFNTARRIKEIGIRKTLGASSGDVVRLLVGQFLRPVLIANLFAWPLAYAAMRTWLAGFDDRIALSAWFFVAATLLALVVALATVLAQSLRASRATPAWALRHD